VLLVGATPDDRAALARSAAREDVGDALAYAPHLPDERLAALVRGARAAILPALSEAAGFAAIEAIACGTPVVASAVGALPELVGSAGILVEPREVERLAVALRTVWLDGAIYDRLVAEARARAAGRQPTWSEAARATRQVYAQVGGSRG
jgi:glycosyltransferase involved in cell wall biosynthesis